MRGRPTKAPHDKRTEQVPPIRVTLAERLTIDERAAVVGLSVTDYCRHAILDKPLQIAAARDAGYGPVLAELTRIGVNLNQIARRLNAGGKVPPDIAATINALRGLMTALDPMGAE